MGADRFRLSTDDRHIRRTGRARWRTAASTSTSIRHRLDRTDQSRLQGHPTCLLAPIRRRPRTARAQKPRRRPRFDRLVVGVPPSASHRSAEEIVSGTGCFPDHQPARKCRPHRIPSRRNHHAAATSAAEEIGFVEYHRPGEPTQRSDHPPGDHGRTPRHAPWYAFEVRVELAYPRSKVPTWSSLTRHSSRSPYPVGGGGASEIIRQPDRSTG